MGVIKYFGGPNNAELIVGGKPLSVTRGQTYELENALIAKLVASDPAWWEVVEGYTPPPPGEEEVWTVTEAVTIGPKCKTLFVNAQAGSLAPIGLPNPKTNLNRLIEVSNIATNSNYAELETPSGQIKGPNLAGATTLKLGATQIYGGVSLRSDGTNWRVV